MLKTTREKNNRQDVLELNAITSSQESSHDLPKCSLLLSRLNATMYHLARMQDT